jgi:archaellum component FlaC
LTVDERIERLTERHEALSQSVELVGHNIAELVRVVSQDAENIRSQVRIAEIHERRLTGLEQ